MGERTIIINPGIYTLKSYSIGANEEKKETVIVRHNSEGEEFNMAQASADIKDISLKLDRPGVTTITVEGVGNGTKTVRVYGTYDDKDDISIVNNYNGLNIEAIDRGGSHNTMHAQNNALSGSAYAGTLSGNNDIAIAQAWGIAIADDAGGTNNLALSNSITDGAWSQLSGNVSRSSAISKTGSGLNAINPIGMMNVLNPISLSNAISANVFLNNSRAESRYFSLGDEEC